MRRTMPFDQADVAVEQAGLHRPDGRAADDGGGLRTSTRGSRAARWNSASAEMFTPGQMTPPRYSPRAVIASKVVAVPKSTTISARRPAGRPAVALVRGHAVDDAVGADLGGRVVEHRHAGVVDAVDDQRLAAEVALRHFRRSAASASARPTPSRRRPPGRSSSWPCWNNWTQPHAHLVRRPLAQRGQPPAVKQAVAVEHADDDVGVADVECEEHRIRLRPPDFARDHALGGRRRSRPAARRPRPRPRSSLPPTLRRPQTSTRRRARRRQLPPAVEHRAKPVACVSAGRRATRPGTRASPPAPPADPLRGPSSVSSDVARCAMSGGYAAGRTLMP